MVTLTRKQRAALIGVALDKPPIPISLWAMQKGICDDDVRIIHMHDLIDLAGARNRRHWDITDRGLEALESYDNSQTSAATGEDADAS